MAEGKDPAVGKGVKELEEEITCAICHEHYTEPKVLPCCHYYCKQCLHQLTLRKGAHKPFSCPECRKDTTLPEGGLDNLPTAFFVNRMKEVHSKLELAHGKVEAKCEMCSEDKAEAFCRQCAKFACTDCAKNHLKMKKLFPGHKVSTLEELREGGAEEILATEPSFQTCKIHKQPMNVYCYDCTSLVCRDCTMKDHLSHNYEFVIVAAPQIKQKLVQQLDPLRESRMKMLHAVDDIYTTISEVEDQGKSVVKKIGTSFAELRKIIDDHEQELLTETATKVEQKCKHLLEQGKGLSIACAAVESVIDYTEHCVEHSADDEIMCMHTEIQSRINREIEEQEGKDLEPVEEVDLGVEVNCAEDLKQLFQTKAKVIKLHIDPRMSAVTDKKAGSSPFHVLVAANDESKEESEDVYVPACESEDESEDDSLVAACKSEDESEDDALVAACKSEDESEDDSLVAACESEDESEDDSLVAACESEDESEDDALVAACKSEDESEDDALVAACKSEDESEDDALVAPRKSEDESEDDALVAPRKSEDESEDDALVAPRKSEDESEDDALVAACKSEDESEDDALVAACKSEDESEDDALVAPRKSEDESEDDAFVVPRKSEDESEDDALVVPRKSEDESEDDAFVVPRKSEDESEDDALVAACKSEDESEDDLF